MSSMQFRSHELPCTIFGDAKMTTALFGSASMWMAVFADMGASLLVVGNGVRILRWTSDKDFR